MVYSKHISLSASSCRSVFSLDQGCCTGDLSSCYMAQGRCFCDRDCHARGDCCKDVQAIGCTGELYYFESYYTLSMMLLSWLLLLLFTNSYLASTCAGLRLSPGCCNAGSCYANGGQCYCDFGCQFKGDCCGDVPSTLTCSQQEGKHALL